MYWLVPFVIFDPATQVQLFESKSYVHTSMWFTSSVVIPPNSHKVSAPFSPRTTHVNEHSREPGLAGVVTLLGGRGNVALYWGGTSMDSEPPFRCHKPLEILYAQISFSSPKAHVNNLHETQNYGLIPSSGSGSTPTTTPRPPNIHSWSYDLQ